MSDNPKRADRTKTVSPREVMRQRHPDLFSDSEQVTETTLAKPVFEHHLQTLTDRNEEAEFEHFARALVERTICPTIRAQSGPMGGGDGKVDGDSYPVAEAVSERWWVGAPKAEESWAFAFSAMRDWRKKVRTDVQKIVATKRGYTHIYFVTSRPAKASTRADVEKELRETYGVPVTVLDRAWIVQQIYDRGYLRIALEKLNLPGVSAEIQVSGPRDVARLKELAELDEKVADPTTYGGARYQLAEDILDSAVLARALERPESEIRARFLQAERIAKSVGDSFQIQRVIYQRAWTAYWWFEDFAEFNTLYDAVEAEALGQDEARRGELLLNLWQLLFAHVTERGLEGEIFRLESRTARLRADLERVAAVTARPNNALQAKTSVALMRLILARAAQDEAAAEAIWPEMEAILSESRTMGAYPVERLFDLSKELGAISDSPEFDRFFENLVEVMAARRSDGEAGLAYIQRGSHKIEKQKYYEAIRLFGRAEALLAKDEYRGELSIALLGGSHALQEVGLRWAARNKALAAVEKAFSALRDHGQFIRPMLTNLRHLAWTELALGRIPHTLLALNMARNVRPQIAVPEEYDANHREELANQDAILGMHLLRLPVEVLHEVVRMHATFESLGLPASAIALMHSLGQDQRLYDEGTFPAGQSREETAKLFEAWLGQPAAADIAAQPILIGAGVNLLRSTILGCEVIIRTPSDAVALSIAEAVLGGLEAFLATSNEHDVFPYRESLLIQMIPATGEMALPEFSWPDVGTKPAELAYPQILAFDTPDAMVAWNDWLQETIVHLFSQMLRIPDFEGWIEKIASQEKGFSRALLHGNIPILSENVFGDSPKVTLADWIDPEAEAIPVLRTEPFGPASPVGKRKPGQPGVGQSPDDPPDYESLKHTDRKVLTPIDMSLWDRANWSGVGFIMPEEGGHTPLMAFLFSDYGAGRAIFENWLERFGREDRDEALRIALITGLKRGKPAEYGVTVGPNFESPAFDVPETSVVTNISRINRMSAASSLNLDRFLKRYRETGTYVIAPAEFDRTKGLGEVAFDLTIGKRELTVKEAWTIGENDFDMMVLADDDDPIIPAGVSAAPVSAALRRIREMRSRRST